MIDAAIFLGEPIQFKNICKIYPPKIKDVVANLETQRYITTLCWNQDDIEDILYKNQVKSEDGEIPTPFEFIMASCYANSNFQDMLIRAIQFFTKETTVYVFPNQMCIYLGPIEEISEAENLNDLRRITPENFLDFQNAIRETLGFEPEVPETESLNPIIKRIREAEKKRKRAAKNKKNKSGIEYTTTLCALCHIGVGLTPFNVGDLPYAAASELLNMYWRKERYEIDIRSIQAGADPKKIRPKYWIKPDNNLPTIPTEGVKGL